jgi:hypothetical protein
MSRDYWLVFWAAMVGFYGVTLWLFQLRLRLAAAVERRADDDE